MTTLLGYLQSPAALPFAVAILVAIVRRFAPRIDGPALVCAAAVVAGAVLAVAQRYLVPGAAELPALGVLVEGAVAGFVAFGGHDLLSGLLSQAGPLTVMSAPSSTPESATVSYDVRVDASQATAALADLQAMAESTAASVAKVSP